MKLKFTLSIFSLFLLLNFGISQEKSVDPIPARQVKKALPETTNTNKSGETEAGMIVPRIFDENDCSTNLFDFLASDVWGSVAGQNGFFDLEKAQRFVYNEAESYTIEEVSIFVAFVDVVGNGELTLNIYDVDENTNGPGELLGTSEAIRASDLGIDEVDVVPTQFVFPNPPLSLIHI